MDDETEIEETGESHEFGRALLKTIDPHDYYYNKEQRAKIRAIADKETLRKFIYQDLSSVTEPDVDTAHRVFGSLISQENELAGLLMSWEFYAIFQVQRCIEDSDKILARVNSKIESKVNAINAKTNACKVLKDLIQNARMIAKMGKKQVRKPEPVKRLAMPKNGAPTLGG